MLVEFVGCSSSGKTTLVKRVLCGLHLRGLQCAYAPDLVAQFTGTTWSRNLRRRHLMQNVLLLPWSIQSICKNYVLYKLSVALILRDATTTLERISRLRSLMRQMASDELLKGRSNRIGLTVADENAIGSAHNVFAHIDRAPDLKLVRRYADLVPGPDLIIHVDVPLDVAVERTMKRPDLPSRLRRTGRRRDCCERFLSNSLAIFRELTAADVFEGRVFSVNNAGGRSEALEELTDRIIEFILDRIGQD